MGSTIQKTIRAVVEGSIADLRSAWYVLAVADVVDRADATAFAAHADLGLLVHLDLGDHPAGRGVQSGEIDAGLLADQTASSVAPDEVPRARDRPSDSSTSTPVSSCAKPVTSCPR